MRQTHSVDRDMVLRDGAPHIGRELLLHPLPPGRHPVTACVTAMLQHQEVTGRTRQYRYARHDIAKEVLEVVGHPRQA